MKADHRQLLGQLLRRKSVVHGRVKLSSGRVSDYFLDCKLTTLDPEGAVMTGYSILELLESEGIKADAIGGPIVGADPIVAAVAAVSYLQKKPLPAFLVRKERKTYGRQKQIEGIELRPGLKVVIVDEVCTTGESTLDAIRVAEEAKLQVLAVISLVDREEGGSEKLRAKYPYFRLFTAKELLQDEFRSETEARKSPDHTVPPAARNTRTS